jgi:hypothetical protein
VAALVDVLTMVPDPAIPEMFSPEVVDISKKAPPANAIEAKFEGE